MAFGKTPKHKQKNKKPKTPAQIIQFKKFASKGGKASARKRKGTHLKHPRKSTKGRPRTQKQKDALKAARKKHHHGSWNKGRHYHLKHKRKSPRKTTHKSNPHAKAVRAALTSTSRSRTHRYSNVRFSKNVSNYKGPRVVARTRVSAKRVNYGSQHSGVIPGYNPFNP